MCATRVLYPCPSPSPLPFCPGVSPTLVFPRSPSLTPSWLPCALLGGGCVFLRTGLWPCPRTGMVVGILRTMSHRIFGRNTERTTVRRLSNSLHCICTVEPSRIDQLRRRCTELFQSDQSPQSDPVWSPRVHTLLHLAGVPWRRRPPRPGAFRVGRGQPHSRARASPMASMQQLLALQRALPPVTDVLGGGGCPSLPPPPPEVTRRHKTRHKIKNPVSVCASQGSRRQAGQPFQRGMCVPQGTGNFNSFFFFFSG